MKNIVKIILFFLSLISITCDHGIDPNLWMDPGFSGKITFIGKWPPKDSLVDLRLVVYKKYPPPIFIDFTKFSDAIPSGLSSFDYKMLVPPGNYEYIVVAQQYGPNVFLHWKAIGFYCIDEKRELPTSLKIDENTFLKNINIIVDFEHPPAQPFLYK